MEKIIGIVDYGMGNINSVYNALTYLGYEAEIVTTVQEIERCSHLIVPGVGSYAKAMANIAELGVDVAIVNHAKMGKPLLGICLGMQILSEVGEEGGNIKGLGLIPGRVQLLDLVDLPVPHVGWNSLNFNADHPMFASLKKHVDFYFVHSYFFDVESPENVLASSDYGNQFAAIVGKKNIVGIQFHPEKSQDNGLLLIENFCEWNGEC
ncbi:imidazole glycerol phosphate synthase subunit HisH [Legionella antarctica]|uniref:Imidazole glycerol phosphate synthase subunit HisH n=1 Tax=Legionella antarctica TaxID=2708020 RepID=A0A6F8T399_9GAMM|nr:imidazole glycerol phosphate synthase subunit HisH [Legionella antarctica]BCA94941.1 imidazole glycerol phosphate synthase subunit HisH [Legionella antarctica]